MVAAGPHRSVDADLVEIRRELHRFPEIGLRLPGTQSTVRSAPTGLDLPTGQRRDSVTAALRVRHPRRDPGRVVLLRADQPIAPRGV